MKRHGYIIGGQVQGVGFRPFVYRLAQRLHLSGFVGNTSDGVRVEVQGKSPALDAFESAFEQELPPLARITSLCREELPSLDDEEGFRILLSEGRQGHAVLISPDVATCDHCLADMRDPANRRYQYPFTNCTDCGPRYTITRSIPYDRETTTMSCFPLCPDCAAEYHDPLNRRFHAQPNACPDCGPQVWLSTPDSQRLTEGQQAIADAATALATGRILAAKGLGGFHLVCDAANPVAVATLRERKHRPHKSLAVMVPDIVTARAIVELSPAEETLLTSPERPIVVLRSRGLLPASIAPDVGSIGVMLPYTPLHHLLLEAFATHRDTPVLVMTSGNAGGEPIALGNREALSRLYGIADLFLLHNRDILIRADDSVVRVQDGGEAFAGEGGGTLSGERLSSSLPRTPSLLLPKTFVCGHQEDLESQAGAALRLRNTGEGSGEPEAQAGAMMSPVHVFRRARGYVPRPLPLPMETKTCVLGVGAELKSTLCLTRGKNAFVSQHIGDLSNLETLGFFEGMAKHLAGLLEVTPQVVVCDLHPDYLSTAYAQASGLPTLRIQHHFAHIYSVLGENEHDGPALGLALDGTGYGSDGTIWGGELLFVHPKAATTELYGGRIGRLAPFPLPGGEAAIREPWRLVSGFMGLPQFEAHRTAFREHLEDTLGAPARPAVHDAIVEMVRRGATPQTSSCGRLFDAVSALLGLCPVISYEGQAAIRLEEAYHAAQEDDSTPFPLREQNGLLELDTAAFFLHLLKCRESGIPVSTLARRFHLGLVEGLAELALAGARRCGIRTVALSGGVLHNAVLSRLLPEALRQRGLVPLTHRALPPGDGGISYGQAVWAAHVLHSSTH